MTTRSRHLVLMLVGFGMVILSIPDQPSRQATIDMASGLLIAAGGGYGYLHPDKTNSPTAYLLVAVGGFILALLMVFFLIRSYGITGFFSTGGSTTVVGYAAFMLFVSAFMLSRYFSLRHAERK